METKKLYRSTTDKIFAGICGGLGEYFQIDSIIVRLIWILIVVLTGIFPGVIVYIIAIFLIPRKSVPTPVTPSTPPTSTN